MLSKCFIGYFLAGLLAVIGLVAPSVVRAQATTVYIIRHAEKELTPGLADPPLTVAGEARARALSAALGQAKPAALFTTDTKRTRATLAPLAVASGLVPQVYAAPDPAALAARIRQEYAGRAVVVVGHSNTLLPLITALGATAQVASISDEEYDNLFVVRLPKRAGRPAAVVRRRYGAAAQAAVAR